MSSNRNTAGRALADGTTIFFVALAALSVAGLWLHSGPSEVADALTDASGLLLGIAPVIAVALLIGGYVQALLSQELVLRWLGEGSGLGGYLAAVVAGTLTPAGPFAAFPLVTALRYAGAPFDVCVVYLTAWATLGINRVVIWELPFLGPDFVVLRALASLPLPFIAGLTARLLVERAR